MEYDQKIPAATGVDPSSPSVKTSPPSTLSRGADLQTQIDKMQEVSRRANVSKEDLMAPRQNYSPEAQIVLNDLWWFYHNVDTKLVAVPACDFAGVGITPSIAWDLVGDKVWTAFYQDQVDAVDSEWMVPTQLHIIMRHMLAEASIQVKKTAEEMKVSAEKASQQYVDLVKGAGKGGRFEQPY
jgi:hypothetical protein